MLVQTHLLHQEDQLEESLRHQVYCGLDCSVMTEVFEEVSETYKDQLPSAIYNFERALQGPYLDIMMRGFLVDQISRQRAAVELHRRIDFLTLRLNSLAMAVWQKPLIRPDRKLPHSSVLQDLFFQSMRLPEVWTYQKGQKKLSLGREALEKLEGYLYARPFISLILSLRDLYKQLQVFEDNIDSDGRYRTSYNIAGTETGRPSSSENPFGTGGNMQNISPSLRYVFVADPGYRLAVIDLEQVEARDVGFFIGCLFEDWTYLDACESGDLHTNNARRIWPEQDWTGEPQEDRKLAERNFYREFSYRDMAKRGSHLSNYMGTAYTAARALKVPQSIMEEFQARYCRGRPATPAKYIQAIEPAFPGIPRWWQWTSQQLQTTGILTTPFGRRRHFFGRPDDQHTLREAIAFLPQSTTADRMNLGLWRTWRHMPQIQLLAQTYDSITFQYKETLNEAEVIEEALERIRVLLRSSSGRDYVVPGEAKVGWNWGQEVTPQDVEKNQKGNATGRQLRLNLDGLRKWNPQKRDERVRQVGMRRTMT